MYTNTIVYSLVWIRSCSSLGYTFEFEIEIVCLQGLSRSTRISRAPGGQAFDLTKMLATEDWFRNVFSYYQSSTMSHKL